MKTKTIQRHQLNNGESEYFIKKKQKEMHTIARTLNRYVQPHDPYLLQKYERYDKIVKGDHSEKLHQRKMSRRHKSSKSHADLIGEFLNKRGLSVESKVESHPLHDRTVLGQSISNFGNSSSQTIGHDQLIQYIQTKDGQKIFMRKNLSKKGREEHETKKS